MSDVLSTYTFIPWLRQGIANKVTATDFDAAVKLRATININMDIVGTPVSGETDLKESINKDIQLYGPGDIVGIDKKAIVKNEPLHWITNFEPNYLPYIEFYDEDFPWRYLQEILISDKSIRGKLLPHQALNHTCHIHWQSIEHDT